MDIPFEPEMFGIQWNIHLILEYAAFFIGFRYYLYLKKKAKDQISSTNRLSIIIGAVFGAFFGSRIIGFLEAPYVNTFNLNYVLQLLNAKTIMGGLFGGLIGVELAKCYIGERKSSGDLFTFPIILGIIIGRIGCFLVGDCYGKPCSLPWAMTFKDGLPPTTYTTFQYNYPEIFSYYIEPYYSFNDVIKVHPTQLYEMAAYFSIFFYLRYRKRNQQFKGEIMFEYLFLGGFVRFMVEFIRTNTKYLFDLSGAQYLSILMMGIGAYQMWKRRRINQAQLQDAG